MTNELDRFTERVERAETLLVASRRLLGTQNPRVLSVVDLYLKDVEALVDEMRDEIKQKDEDNG